MSIVRVIGLVIGVAALWFLFSMFQERPTGQAKKPFSVYQSGGNCVYVIGYVGGPVAIAVTNNKPCQ